LRDRRRPARIYPRRSAFPARMRRAHPYEATHMNSVPPLGLDRGRTSPQPLLPHPMRDLLPLRVCVLGQGAGPAAGPRAPKRSSSPC
jgi:hypothetical protein